MKKITLFFSAAILLVGLATTSSFISASTGPSANGQAALLNPWFNGQVQHFAFQARTINNVVTGSWETKSPGQNVRIHGTIDCLTILPDGITAIMTGIVTQKVGEGYPGIYEVGSKVWFKVIDNGQGNSSTADQFSDYYPITNPATTCNQDFGVDMYDIISGNVQVKP